MSKVDRTRWDALPMPTKVGAALLALMCGTGYNHQTGQYVIVLPTLRGVLDML